MKIDEVDVSRKNNQQCLLYLPMAPHEYLIPEPKVYELSNLHLNTCYSTIPYILQGSVL